MNGILTCESCCGRDLTCAPPAVASGYDGSVRVTAAFVCSDCGRAFEMPLKVRKAKTVRWLLTAVEKGYRVEPDGSAVGPHGPVEGSLHLRKRSAAYHSMTVKVGSESKRVMTHQLQAYQKFGIAAMCEGVQVRHLNGDSLDNREENITLGTPRANQLDRAPEARKAHAQKAANARRVWTASDVRRLRARRQAGESMLVLAREEGVSKGTMSMMLRGVTYKNVPIPKKG